MPGLVGVCLVPVGGLVPGGVGCLVPGVAWRPPGTATAVGGRHPTGMHSCLMTKPFKILQAILNSKIPFKMQFLSLKIDILLLKSVFLMTKTAFLQTKTFKILF